MKALILILALVPSLTRAQSLIEQLAEAPLISYEEWLDMTQGKTVVYEIEGAEIGYENYQKDGKVTIRLNDGTCIDGTWYMDQSAFCFDWEDGPLNCFNHKRLGDRIFVIGLNNGAETSDIQRVSRIVYMPLFCGPALLTELSVEARP